MIKFVCLHAFAEDRGEDDRGGPACTWCPDCGAILVYDDWEYSRASNALGEIGDEDMDRKQRMMAAETERAERAETEVTRLQELLRSAELEVKHISRRVGA